MRRIQAPCTRRWHKRYACFENSCKAADHFDPIDIAEMKYNIFKDGIPDCNHCGESVFDSGMSCPDDCPDDHPLMVKAMLLSDEYHETHMDRTWCWEANAGRMYSNKCEVGHLKLDEVSHQLD